MTRPNYRRLLIPSRACSYPWHRLFETGSECIGFCQLCPPTISPDEQTYKEYSLVIICVPKTQSSISHSSSTDLLVSSNASLIMLNPSEVSSQTLTSAARHAEGSLTRGPLVMLSARIRLMQPPLSWTGKKTLSAGSTHRNNSSQS